MIRAAVSLTLAGMASAFMAPSAGRASTQLDAKAKAPRPAPIPVEEQSVAIPGSKRPDGLDGGIGDFGFDPFGLAAKGDVAVYRANELKHGRLAMLAVTGFIAQAAHPINIFPWAQDSKNIFDALKTVPTLGVVQILLAITFIEVSTTNYEGRVPGDVGFDPLNLSRDGIDERYALVELKHARLAMVGFLGCLIQQIVSPVNLYEQTVTYFGSL